MPWKRNKADFSARAESRVGMHAPSPAGMWGNGGGQMPNTHVQRARIHIHKHRFGARQDDGVGGGGEGQRRGNDFITGFQSQGEQVHMQAGGGGRQREAIRRAQISTEVSLKSFYARPRGT